MPLPGHLSGVRRHGRGQRLTTTIWTIGHGAGSFDDVERRLAEYGITMIVDIRHDPDRPRIPDLRRRRLEDLASEAGIGYRWMGTSLGRRSSADSLSGLDDLIALAAVSPTVILGEKQDPTGCHRSITIAPALRARDVEVIHILADGSARRHESPLPFDR